MSGENWTPGPWQLFDDERGKRVWGDGRKVAEILEHNMFYYDAEQTYANAHLICAAPEMYEALKAILPYVPISSASEGGAVARSGNVLAADKVRAALKKARGES